MIATYRRHFLTLLFIGLPMLLYRPALSATPSTSLEQIHDLGVQSINGDGVPVDLAKGRYYIQQSALQGYPLGQYHLGILFFTGEGGPQSSACATWWLKKAIAANNEVQAMAQEALDDIQDEMRVTADEFDAQRCQQYSYSLVHSPMTEPVQPESQADTMELFSKENHALLEASQNHKPHRIYTSIRALQNALTTIWQPIAQHRERLMLASAHNAHLQQQLPPVIDETVPDEPTEVIITLVLPPSEQKSETEQIESMPIDMPSKPIEVTIPTTKKTAESTNLGGDIRSASSRHYTLQLGSAASAEGLYEQARRHKLSNYLVYETVRNNRQWYVLVYGEYPSIRSAKHAIHNLPSAFQRDKPWVRSIQHVQSELN
ncbi:SPOR domain-containing protein [Providencia alcalifaciens]|uniref:SPOR domain-containing protein n=2 Tax=Providencia alcalifaciens TaxID=126385 RepID=UPI001CC41EDD|nr:SPOR domain-containing protein [Providencia alcalifaciens]CAG9428357.1 Cell division protein DamX [Providencia alcalifaciens]CAG9432073.1 Cell division protein DamX [Providencia alcalifaciens]CAG9432225.1 Cell division protein DamX [Providencia alcalifaciens]CAG9433169.1 Cell division protein DamX [Providencia alcalifaciens]CAG9433416.1 Cell division protein DamX [Providencia alcalifaciens]